MKFSRQSILDSLERFWVKHHRTLAISLLAFLLIIAFLADRIFISIMPGEAGVLWKRFNGGVVLDKVYNEGLHIINPWNQMFIYDVRIHEFHDKIKFLDTNGLEIEARVSIRFRPDREKLPRLHQRIGPEYHNKVVVPELVSALRIVMGTVAYKDTYIQSESRFNQEISQRITDVFALNDLILDDVLLTGLSIPTTVEEAIQAKLVYQQQLLAYEYRLEAEQREKERKRIEGEGIALFESQSNIPILQWLGIQATEELAKSPNSKVIIIGNDAGSLPVILSAEP